MKNADILGLLRDMVDPDITKRLDAESKFTKEWRENGRIIADKPMLQIISEAANSYQAEEAAKLLVRAHLSGTESSLPENVAERAKRLNELGNLANEISGPQKDAVVSSLEYFGLQTPRMAEQQKREKEQAEARDREEIKGFADKGEIVGPRFALHKDHGQLKVLSADAMTGYVDKANPKSVHDQAFSVEASKSLGLRTNLEPIQFGLLRDTLAKASAVPGGKFTPADLKAFDHDYAQGQHDYHAAVSKRVENITGLKATSVEDDSLIKVQVPAGVNREKFVDDWLKVRNSTGLTRDGLPIQDSVNPNAPHDSQAFYLPQHKVNFGLLDVLEKGKPAFHALASPPAPKANMPKVQP